jgi:glycosyltransferase involved in cell wall biosynthesis/peptidoglycan/xylan/chitin deacetylase (PgdA/CDA1 family)
MRIVHLIDSLDCGGAEQVATSLAIHQSLQGHSVWVVCLRDLGPRPVDTSELGRAGVEILMLGKPPGFHVATLRRLTAFLKDQQIEVMHAHNHIVHHYGAAAARWAGAPAILNTLHGTASLQTASSWTKALFWFSCFISNRVVSVCPQVHTVFQKSFPLPPKKLCIVDNGIDLARFLGIPRHPPRETVTFGIIGRFDPVKDHKNLLYAFAILRKRHPHVQLRLLGDGALRHDLEELARTLSISDDVHFEGFSLDIARFLRNIDIYVLSSRSEGLPLTLLEAMGAALPVVATAVGEVPSILSNARCGWLCPPSNPDRLAEAMETAIQEPDLATFGARGRNAADKYYSLQRMARDYESLYDTLLSRRRLITPAPGVIRKLTLSLLSSVGAFRLGELVSSRNLLVLSYHRVIPRDRFADGRRPSNTHFIDEFEEQMAFVAKRFNVLTGDTLHAIIDGTRAIPPYSLAITFDDGYENNFSYVLPILQRYGLHAAFFLTTNFIGNKDGLLWFDRLDRLLSIVPSGEILEWLHRLDPALTASSDTQIRPYFKGLPSARQSEILDRLEQQFGHPGASTDDNKVYGFMSWDQVRLMASAGMTIGSHTANHQILAAVSPAKVQTELQLSLKRIEKETDRACWCFAYPNGERRDFRPSDELAVQGAGYLCAFTQISGSINSHTPRYALPRIPIPATGDMRSFRSHLSGIHRALGTMLRAT